MNSSPFKFLDAYTKADRSIFFGRSEEIEQLYEMVHQTNLTLVYGQSGTGKTSLIQCGLANRFQTSDWFNIYVRWNDEINQSLLQTLRQHEAVKSKTRGTLLERLQKHRKKSEVQGKVDEEVGLTPVIQTLRSLHDHYLKPIYLIFDQFEELFISGSEREQGAFYDTVAEIQSSEGYCRMIFVLREEAIALLYDFEKIVPSLFDKRLRVEPMSRSKIRDVIINSCEKFQITLEDEQVPDDIIDAISGGQGRVELTYLQVFLDQLYHLAASTSSIGVRFSQPLVAELGDIDDVLADFLDRQSADLEVSLDQNNASGSHRNVVYLLSTFVTLEGTKKPLTREQVQIPQFSAEQVDFCLEHLEKGRILRFDQGRYELSHDALARQIVNKRSAEDIAYLEVIKLIKDRYGLVGTTETYLNSNEVVLLETYRHRLKEENKLSEEEWKYISESIRKNKARSRQRQRIVTGVISVLSILMIAAVVFGFQARQEKERAETAQQEAQDNYQKFQKQVRETANSNFQQYFNLGQNAMARSDYLGAIQSFQTALTFDSTSEQAKQLIGEAGRQSNQQDRFELLIQEGDALAQMGDDTRLTDARSKYREALATGYNDNLANSKLVGLQGRLDSAFDRFKSNGSTLMTAKGWPQALIELQHALSIKDDPEVKRLFDYCKNQLQSK